MKNGILALVLVSSVCFCQTVLAQETRASVSGRVLDESGGVMPGVEVTAANVAMGVEVSTVTNDLGIYRIDYLVPGEFEIRASIPGFRTTRQLTRLTTGERRQLDITLQLGEVTEEVTVTAGAALLQVADADRGQLVQGDRIETIPLAQGNVANLMLLAAGSVANSTALMFDEPGFATAGGVGYHGITGGATNFTLGGIPNSLSEFGGSSAPSVNPPQDAVHEFRVSHAYDASQGFHSGSSVDISLKGGANRFHGSAYGFFRDSDWDANTFFNNRAGVEKTSSTYRRLGASITGPIFKDQTFFAFAYEDTYQETAELHGTRTVPTPQQLSGDFSALLDLGPAYQIYDPFSTRATGDGFFERDPFPGNIIPADRIHPISKKLMEFWPAPNLPGGPDGTLNFQPSTASPTEWIQVLGRIDHTFTSNHRLFAHYAILDHEGEWRDYYGNLATGFWQTIRKQTFGLDDVLVVNPQLVLNFRYGFTRAFDPRLHKSSPLSPGGNFDITTLGLSQDLIGQLDLSRSTLPHILISGYSGIHDETRNDYDAAQTHSAEANVDFNRGAHALKFGFSFRSNVLNQGRMAWTYPRYHFGPTYTSGPLNISPSAQGQGLAAFLLGQPSGGFINRADNIAAGNPYYALFVQNNWRATPEFTVNFGLRWEYYSAVMERFDRSARGFDFDAASPIEAAARAAYTESPIPEIPVDQFRVRGGLTFAGTGGEPRELYDTPGGILNPRVGLAYRLTGDSVLRAGYGLYAVPLGVGSGPFQPILAGFTQTTDLVPTFDEGQTFIATFENPFPSGILSPVGSSLGLATDMGRGVTFFNTASTKIPYNQRWSLSIQHMFPLDTMVEIGYIGTRATRLVGTRNLNALPAEYLSTLPTRDRETIAFLSESVPNPFAGLLPGTALNTVFTNRSQLLTPFPHFGSVNLRGVNQGYTWYHGFEASVEKRLDQGVSYVVNYTWSKAMEAVSLLNATDPLPHEVVSGSDITHNVQATTILELPFGRERRFGSGASSGLLKVIEGWQISAVWQLQSGFPLGFGNVFTDSAFDPQNLPLPGSERTVDRWFNIDAGFIRDPSEQPAFNLRSFPLRFSNLRQDTLSFWDINVIKNTSIGERYRVQFHASFLNAFNTPAFSGINTNPASGSFGRAGGEMTWPRRIMLGVRFTF